MRLPFPPPDEQRYLGERIEQIAHSLDEAAIPTRESIDRLREYRQALITAAVTGQIDVTRDAP